MSFHHGPISRMEAESVLTAAKQDGSFLVRDSETIKGAYTLCLLYDGRVHQYRILPDGDGNIFVQAERGVAEKKYVDLQQLIYEYKQRGSNNGLTCALRFPVGKRETMVEDKDSGVKSQNQANHCDDEVDFVEMPFQDCTVKPPIHSIKRQQNKSILRSPAIRRKTFQSPLVKRKNSLSEGSVGDLKLIEPLCWETQRYSVFPFPAFSAPTVNEISNQDSPIHRGTVIESSRESHHRNSEWIITGQGSALFLEDEDEIEGTFHSKKTMTQKQQFYENTNSYTDYEPFISRYFLQRFAQLDLSSVDGEFLSLLKNYIDDGVLLDAKEVESGSDHPARLSNMLISLSKKIEEDLTYLQHKVDLLRQLFGPLSTSPLLKEESKLPSGSSIHEHLELITERMSSCKTAVNFLERKAVKRFQDLILAEPEESRTTQDISTLDIQKPLVIPHCFEAKHTRAGKPSQKISLSVDIHAGKLRIVKPHKEVLDDSNVFSHEKIQQIVKSTKDKCRVDIRIEGRKKETYVFESVHDREHFCQMVKLLKVHHSMYSDVSVVSIFIGTYNMADEQNPRIGLAQWLKCKGLGISRNPGLVAVPHDIYVIGTQECAISEKDWTNKIKATIRDNFGVSMHVVASASLWAIRLLVLVKEEYQHKITHVQTSSVKTGIANALGNKGAVGVSFMFNGTSFAFVNCHLTSGDEKNSRRNQNYRDIIKGLTLGPKNLQSLFDTSNQFHHLFFLGDLNYRLEGLDAQEIIKNIRTERYKTFPNYQSLLHHDQLKKSIEKKEAFLGFCEGEISFPPTYRYEKGAIEESYAWQKFKKTGVRINVPSWCDRVLWRSYPETEITNTAYGCVQEVIASDHKPVFASFDVGIMSQYYSPTGSPTKTRDMQIIFELVEAEVKTSSKEHFMLEFHSPCLEAVIRSTRNTAFNQYVPGYCNPRWHSKDFPVLIPIIDDQDYLEDQHLLVAVKTLDGMESYGEFVVSLASRFSIRPTRFEQILVHHGEVTGKISGTFHVKAKEGSARAIREFKRRRSFEIIYQDTSSMSFRESRDSKLATAQQAPANPISRLQRKKSNSMEDLSKYKIKVHEPERWSTTVNDEHVFSMSHSSSATNLPPRNSSSSSSHLDLPPTSNLPPRARPRLGQSSLAPHSSVLPVSCSKSDSAAKKKGITTSKNIELDPRQKVQTFNAMPDDSSDIQLTNVASNSTANPLLRRDTKTERQSVNRQTPHWMIKFDDNPAYVGVEEYQNNNDISASVTGSTVLKRDEQRSSVESDDSALGPPMPPRNYKEKDRMYVTLEAPRSISEWLLNLGIPQYIQLFHNHGWDNIDFIIQLTREDLMEMEILNTEHQSRIMQSVRDLKVAMDK